MSAYRSYAAWSARRDTAAAAASAPAAGTSTSTSTSTNNPPTANQARGRFSYRATGPASTPAAPSAAATSAPSAPNAAPPAAAPAPQQSPALTSVRERLAAAREKEAEAAASRYARGRSKEPEPKERYLSRATPSSRFTAALEKNKDATGPPPTISRLGAAAVERKRDPSPAPTSTGRYGPTIERKRDPSPVPTSTTRFGSTVERRRDPSPAATSTSRYGSTVERKRDPSPATTSTSRFGSTVERKRDPSPATSRFGSSIERKRDPSPATTASSRYGSTIEKKRDPSPATTSNRFGVTIEKKESPQTPLPGRYASTVERKDQSTSATRFGPALEKKDIGKSPTSSRYGASLEKKEPAATPTASRFTSEKRDTSKASTTSRFAAGTGDKKEGSLLSRLSEKRDSGSTGYRARGRSPEKTSRFLPGGDKKEVPGRDRSSSSTSGYSSYRPTTLYTGGRSYSSGLSSYRSSNTSQESPVSSAPNTPSSSVGSAGGAARSPLTEKPPLVFGKAEPPDAVIPPWRDRETDCVIWMTVITRSTSPTAPSPSHYLRTRRADQARTTERDVKRPTIRPERFERHAQTDDMETRWFRHAGPGSTGWANSYSSGSAVITPTSSKSEVTPPTASTAVPLANSDARTATSPPPQPGKCVAKLKEPVAVKQRVPPIDPEPALVIKIPIKDFRKSALNAELGEKDAVEYERRQAEQRKLVRKQAGGRSTSESSESPSDASPAVRDGPTPPQLVRSATVKAAGNLDVSFQARRSPVPIALSSSPSSASSSEEDEQDEEAGVQPENSARSRLSRSPGQESQNAREKPPRPPAKSPRKGDEKTEDAKSFLMRALGPVTNLFRSAHQHPHKHADASGQESDDGSGSAKRTQDKIADPDTVSIKSNDSFKLYKIRKQYSGEKAWWMDSCENIPEQGGALQRAPSSRSLNKQDSDKESLKSFKIRKQYSGERPWWLESSDNVPAAINRAPSTLSVNSIPEQVEEKLRSPYKIRPVESGERPWWLDSCESVPEGVECITPSDSSEKPVNGLGGSESGRSTASDRDYSRPEEKKYRISHQRSGDRPWWMINSNGSYSSPVPGSPTTTPGRCNTRASVSSSEESSEDESRPRAPTPPRRHRPPPPAAPAAPALEEQLQQLQVVPPPPPVRTSSRTQHAPRAQKPQRPRNLPLFIGGHTNIDDILGNVVPISSPSLQIDSADFDDDSSGTEETREVAADQVRVHDSVAHTAVIEHRQPLQPPGMIKLDDAALQLYKDGDFGAYLDLDASISEQQEDFEDFHANRKNSLVLRTQLSVRVHTIIEKLVTSEGRELRRALFSLKQIFQEDKDLVHEFVQNEGLSCLVQVGSTADQKYQNYILRALGQVMLYVDGMNGVMEHPATLQWLYSLIASRFRLVVKTALKLLLVFIEYTDSNSLLLIRAVHAVDSAEGLPGWSRILRLLMDYDAADTELLIYAMTLLNKTLAGVPDQDTYYDQVDLLEEQGIESVITRYMSRQGTDLDLLRQLQIYEAVLQFEDGERGMPLRQLDDNLRKTLRNRKSLTADLGVGGDRRRSRRHSTGTAPASPAALQLRAVGPPRGSALEDGEDSSSSQSSHLNGTYGGLTPALAQRLANGTSGMLCDLRGANLTPLLNAVNRAQDNNSWAYAAAEEDMPVKRENTVKDLTHKLATQGSLQSPVDENKSFINDMSGMAGIISKAKEGLAKSKSKLDVAAPSQGPPPPQAQPAPKIKSETELHWEELVSNLSRALQLCDLDFTDLQSDDEEDVLCPAGAANGVPLPPPPPVAVPPRGPGEAPPPPAPTLSSPPVFGVSLQRRAVLGVGGCVTDGGPSGGMPPPPPPPPKKNKKTVKLFWKEVRDDPAAQARTHCAPMIWDELRAVEVDTQKLEHLFESRAKDLISKKQQEMNKTKEIIVLDHKRSNAINIGMTKLPPPRSIKTAILKMDATVMNREGIEKLLTMLPTEDERARIQEAQAAAPDTPLGSAEQFLLTLASISELPARLKLWAFKLDYENMEKEIAEPLMDLKQGMETLRGNKTFRCILQTLLSIGIFLNGSHVKGFQIEYLAKVPEVKDTVHKHSLLHHLCHMVMEKFPDASDLYSEIGAVTRASKVDFDELAANICRMETECKASWDRLKLVAKHDGSTMVKVKMSDFLADCAERIIVLSVVHRRVMNRFHRFLLWLGVPLGRLPDTKPNEFCRVVSEFALEYRTTRERVLQQLQKKANHRERNKTRGKMITEVGKFQSKEVRADAELRQLLGSDISDVESLHGSMPWRRHKKDAGRSVLSPLLRDDTGNGDNLTDGDDEILESLVKTATKIPSTRTVPRERKRTRHADRKSLKRSRTRENATLAGNISESP